MICNEIILYAILFEIPLVCKTRSNEPSIIKHLIYYLKLNNQYFMIHKNAFNLVAL